MAKALAHQCLILFAIVSTVVTSGCSNPVESGAKKVTGNAINAGQAALIDLHVKGIKPIPECSKYLKQIEALRANPDYQVVNPVLLEIRKAAKDDDCVTIG